MWHLPGLGSCRRDPREKMAQGRRRGWGPWRRTYRDPYLKARLQVFGIGRSFGELLGFLAEGERAGGVLGLQLGPQEAFPALAPPTHQT